MAACCFYVVFLLRQTNEKNKVMKKAILIVSLLFIVAWCFFASSIATLSYNVIELITICIFELVVLSVPVLAIILIMNFAD